MEIACYLKNIIVVLTIIRCHCQNVSAGFLLLYHQIMLGSIALPGLHKELAHEGPAPASLARAQGHTHSLDLLAWKGDHQQKVSVDQLIQ
jgi:hypothetical protein